MGHGPAARRLARSRARRPTARSSRATDAHLVATAYLALLRPAGRAGRGAARPPGRRRALRRARRRRPATRSTASTSAPPGAWRATRRPATRSRSRSTCWRRTSSARARAGGSPSSSPVAGHRISTGFVGTPLVCDVLEDAGELGAAYALLLQRECPSWLYSVTMGATTVWERWDSLLPDGTVNPGEMTSFNHYALGAVADWMHRTVAGLAPDAPGLPAAPRPPAARAAACATPRPRTRRPTGAPRCAGGGRTARSSVDVVVPPEHHGAGRAARAGPRPGRGRLGRPPLQRPVPGARGGRAAGGLVARGLSGPVRRAGIVPRACAGRPDKEGS